MGEGRMGERDEAKGEKSPVRRPDSSRGVGLHRGCAGGIEGTPGSPVHMCRKKFAHSALQIVQGAPWVPTAHEAGMSSPGRKLGVQPRVVPCNPAHVVQHL